MFIATLCETVALLWERHVVFSSDCYKHAAPMEQHQLIKYRFN